MQDEKPKRYRTPKEVIKNENIIVRVTPEQKKLIQIESQKAGFNKVSKFIFSKCLPPKK